MIRRNKTTPTSGQVAIRSVKPRRQAFTLIELLVVVAIIVSLAGLGGFYFIGILNDSKVSNAKIQAKELTKAVEMYFTNEGEFPQNLEALMVPSPSGKQPLLKPDAALKDPFGHPYQINNGRVESATTLAK
jgi:general secretion pathway protein G